MRRGAALLRIAATALFLPLACLASSPEPALSGVVEAIEANHLELALQRVEKLIAEHPNFRLAHLIRGDLLLARSRPLQTFGDVVKTVPREKVELPKRSMKGSYDDVASLKGRRFVPEKF